MKKLLCICIVCILVFVGCSSNAPQGTTSSSKNPESTSSSQTSSSEETEEELEIVESKDLEFGDFLVKNTIYDNGERTSILELGDGSRANLALFDDGEFNALLMFNDHNPDVEYVAYTLSALFIAQHDGLFMASWSIDGEMEMESYQFKDGKIQYSNGTLGQRYEDFEFSDAESGKMSDLSDAFDAATEFLEGDMQKEPDEEDSDLSSEDSYESGQYKVGTDIPAGEYVVLAERGSGYFSVSADPNNDDITFNGNFDYNTIITIFDGEYLKLSRARAIPFDVFYANNTIDLSQTGVMLYVGKDIEPGEYKLTCKENESGYYCIYDSSRQDYIISNDNFENSAYISVSDGQYLRLSRCYIER